MRFVKGGTITITEAGAKYMPVEESELADLLKIEAGKTYTIISLNGEADDRFAMYEEVLVMVGEDGAIYNHSHLEAIGCCCFFNTDDTESGYITITPPTPQMVDGVHLYKMERINALHIERLELEERLAEINIELKELR